MGAPRTCIVHLRLKPLLSDVGRDGLSREERDTERYGRKLRTMTHKTEVQYRFRTERLAMFLRIYVRLYSDGGGKQFCHRTLDGPRYEPLPLRDQASVLDSRFIDFDVAVIIHLDINA